MFFASKSAQDEEVEESSKSPIEIEVDTYASVGFKLEGLPDARQVWSLEPLKLRYPVLSSVSQDLLIIPASFAPVERVFSTAGVATSGHSGRLSGENLAVKVLLQRNDSYIDYVVED